MDRTVAAKHESVLTMSPSTWCPSRHNNLPPHIHWLKKTEGASSHYNDQKRRSKWIENKTTIRKTKLMYGAAKICMQNYTSTFERRSPSSHNLRHRCDVLDNVFIVDVVVVIFFFVSTLFGIFFLVFVFSSIFSVLLFSAGRLLAHDKHGVCNI